MRVAFAKYQGAGNDFILIDDRHLSFPIAHPGLISSLCQRSWGIGADGLILLQPSFQADFRMRIFNPDGTEPKMCGNGIRCLVAFIQQTGWDHSQCLIETGAGLLQCYADRGRIGVCLGHPRMLFTGSLVHGKEQNWKIDVVDTGVPHGVIFSDHVATLDIARVAPSIRFHPQFSPEGINVNFAQVLSKNSLLVRTYERGVEGETRACGTGAAAAGWLAAEHFSFEQPIQIYNKEKIPILEISYSSRVGVELWGEATCVFQGHFDREGVV